MGVGGIEEDLDEIIAGWSRQGRLGISNAKQEGDCNGETKDAIEQKSADHCPRDDSRSILDFFGYAKLVLNLIC